MNYNLLTKGYLIPSFLNEDKSLKWIARELDIPYNTLTNYSSWSSHKQSLLKDWENEKEIIQTITDDCLTREQSIQQIRDHYSNVYYSLSIEDIKTLLLLYAQRKHTSRNDQIVELYLSGDSQAEISRRFHISRERVRQIVSKQLKNVLKTNEILYTPQGDPYVIRGYLSNLSVEVSFVNNGLVETSSLSISKLLRGKLHFAKPPIKQVPPSVKGIYRGILNRCYSPNWTNYQSYGAKGVTVSDEWKEDINSFSSWYQSQTNWEDPEWHVDKDILGDGLTYSQEHCCLIPKELNQSLTSYGKCTVRKMASNSYRFSISRQGVVKFYSGFTSRIEAEYNYFTKKNQHIRSIVDKYKQDLRSDVIEALESLLRDFEKPYEDYFQKLS